MRDGLPQGLARPSETDSSILLPNGATIWFRSGEHPDSLYGEDVWAAVIDEATRVKPEAWHAVRSTLTATGKVRCGSLATSRAAATGPISWPGGPRPVNPTCTTPRSPLTTRSKQAS